MKTCPECGGCTDDESRACPHCGADLRVRTRRPRHLRSGVDDGTRGQAVSASAATATRANAAKGRAKVFLAIAVVMMLASAGVGFVMYHVRPTASSAASGAPQSALPAVANRRLEPESEPEPADPNLSGWVTDEAGTRRYYDPDTHRYHDGWLDDGDRRLYIDGETGEPHVGWLALDGRRYWLDDGQRAEAGTLLRDQWLELDDGRYHFGDDGSATVGWAEVDGVRRYFDESGAVQVGWVEDGSGKTYWVKPEDGTLANHEWIEIDGVCQAFDDDGSWVTLGDVVPPGDAENMANLSDRQRRVIASCDETPWPGKGLCAGWVSSVFANAGEPYVGGDACDIARAWCWSDDLAELKPGMVIAVASHPRTENGKVWGHVCIYVGDGLIRDSGTYGIRRSSLGSWLAWFGASETPKWGWANGISLEEG